MECAWIGDHDGMSDMNNVNYLKGLIKNLCKKAEIGGEIK